MTASWGRARTIADAVLYEGYLLYPYRASSSTNQSRWQFGVLGPPGAADAGIGEDDTMSTQFLVQPGTGAELTLVVRFLHLQRRRAERDLGGQNYQPVDELTTASGSWLTWDEAVESEFSLGPMEFTDPAQPWSWPIVAAAACDIEAVDGGRLVR